MTKHEDVIKFCLADIKAVERDSDTLPGLLTAIRDSVDTYRVFWCCDVEQRKGKESHELDGGFIKNTRRVHNLYSPNATTDLMQKGMVNICTVNKQGERTGKRADVKLGRYLTMAFPFLDDRQKEIIVTQMKDQHTPLDIEAKWADTGFGDIVSMRSAPSSYFQTTCWFKSLNDSCMRYTKEDLGFDRYHPYDAYCSGDFRLCYLERDGKLYGRVLVNPPTMTYSAIYGVSKPAVDLLLKTVKEAGYKPVDDDECHSWVGQKLLFLADCFNHEDDGITDLDVVITPYIDFLEDEDGWHDYKYIYINEYAHFRRRVDLQDASGYNEL